MEWTPLINKGSGPIYAAICDALKSDIAEGRLKPSDKLPPHRVLAYRLGVTVGTVARAYAEAANRGLVVGEIGRGTFVNDFDENRDDIVRLSVPPMPQHELIDLGLNLSAIGDTDKALKTSLRELARSGSLDLLLNYQPSAGLMSHRTIIADWLTNIGIEASAQNIVITNGGQHGLLISMMALAGHGDTIASEPLTYPGAKAIAHQLGINLSAVSTDSEGMDPDALRDLCETRRPKAIYCMPVLQNPTTVTMTEDRMKEIAAIADHYGLWIIEDDVYGFLAEDRPSPFAALIPERTIYLSSASKYMAPGLRIGFIVAPHKINRMIQDVVTLSNWMSPPLMAAVATEWIASGYADSLIRWHRLRARERKSVAQSVLGVYAQFSCIPCYHLWMPLPEQWRMDSFSTAALREGVRVITADAFCVRRDQSPHAVRLCLGAAHSLSEITLGLEKLLTLLQSMPRPAMDFKTLF